MKQAKNQPKESIPTVIDICAKCSDLFSATVTDATGKTLVEYDGYVPGFFPDQHYGDYVMLKIDLKTGHILNWKQPTKEQYQAFLKQAERKRG